jgi:hypothetical protein
MPQNGFQEPFSRAAFLFQSRSALQAISAQVPTEFPLRENSDDFVLDNQMLLECIVFG